MSQYFEIGDKVLWNPATRVAELYVRLAEAMAPIVDRPTGIGPVIADEYEIDLPVFEAFVLALLAEYERAHHSIMKSMMDGFISMSVVLLERAGSDVPVLRDARLIELRIDHRGAPI
jgi:hypothetical protein